MYRLIHILHDSKIFVILVNISICWNTVLPAAKKHFLIVTFRFRVIQLTKLPRVFVERSEELQVSCDPAYNPWAGKGRAYL